MKKNPKSIIAIILVLISGGAWKLMSQKKEDKAQPTATEQPVAEASTTPASTKSTKSNAAAGRTTKITAGADELLVMSWNLFNFGKSKSAKDITFIANTVKSYDIVAIQEVSTSPAGPQAVAKLADELDRKGADWDYVVSDPTSGDGSERYAYLWKTSRVSLTGKAFLCTPLAATINREPYMARFTAKNGKSVLLASFHAVPTAKKPETEIIQLDKIHTSYTKDNVMVMGDFNYGESKPAFNALKSKGYAPAFADKPTSLKQKLDAKGNYLNEPYDHILYETSAIEKLSADSYDFVPKFPSLDSARNISDHLPVWIKVKVK